MSINKFVSAEQAVTLIEDGDTVGLVGVVQDSLTAVGLQVHVRQVASDERGKTLDEANAVYDWQEGPP